MIGMSKICIKKILLSRIMNFLLPGDLNAVSCHFGFRLLPSEYQLMSILV